MNDPQMFVTGEAVVDPESSNEHVRSSHAGSAARRSGLDTGARGWRWQLPAATQRRLQAAARAR